MLLAISVSIIDFLGFSVLDLGSMYVTDVRQTDVRRHHCLMKTFIRHIGRKHTKIQYKK